MKLEIELDNISLELKRSICEVFNKKYNELAKGYKKYCDKAKLIVDKILGCPKEEEEQIIKEFKELKEENKKLILERDEIDKAFIVFGSDYKFNIELTLEEKKEKGN